MEVLIFGVLSMLFFMGACALTVCRRRRPRDRMIMASGAAAAAAATMVDDDSGIRMSDGAQMSDANAGGRTMPTAALVAGPAIGRMVTSEIGQLEPQQLDGTQVRQVVVWLCVRSFTCISLQMLQHYTKKNYIVLP